MFTEKIVSIFNIRNYFDINSEGVDQGNGIIRVRSTLFESEKQKKRFRNQLVKLQYNDKMTFGVLKLHQHLKDNEIVLTNAMTEDLGISNRKAQYELTILLAGNGNIDQFFKSHPDPALRFSELLSRRRNRN